MPTSSRRSSSESGHSNEEEFDKAIEITEKPQVDVIAKDGNGQDESDDDGGDGGNGSWTGGGGAVVDQDDNNESPILTIQQEKSRSKPVFRLSLDETEKDFNAKLAKRGVIYLPSVPTSMNPTILRQLLEPHGEITRLYLKPNHDTSRSNNKKKRRKRYSEGWVEFSKKSTAKRIAQCLHQTQITNNKRSIMYGDLWSMKYLQRFRWEILTETIAYERRVREQRLRLETMQARKEANHYKERLTQNETLEFIRKRQGKGQTQQNSNHNNLEVSATSTMVPDQNDTNNKRNRSNKRNRGDKQPINEQGAERATKKVLLESLL